MHTSEENKYREGSLEGWWCLACFPSLSKSKYMWFMQDEFEAEKKASLHDKEQMLIQEREKAQAAHQKEQEKLSALLQERAAIITQVGRKYFKPSF